MRGNEIVERENEMSEQIRELTETKKASEDKTIAPKDSPSRAEAPGYVPSLSKTLSAKLYKISENLKSLGFKIGTKGFDGMK